MINAIHPFSKIIIQTCIYISFVSYIYKKESNKPPEKIKINIYNSNLIDPTVDKLNDIDELEKTIHPTNTDYEPMADTDTNPEYENNIINSNEFSNISPQEANEKQLKSAETGHRACSFYALGEYLFSRNN
tara:strand:- start:215 stop:607 length:393 start_codon:yes stop_codon:yes gene_type:complete